MTLKTKMSLLVFLTSLSIVSIGFSSWSITAETTAEINGNIEVDNVIDNSKCISLVNDVPSSFTYGNKGFVDSNGYFVQKGTINAEYLINLDVCYDFLSNYESISIDISLFYSENSLTKYDLFTSTDDLTFTYNILVDGNLVSSTGTYIDDGYNVNFSLNNVFANYQIGVNNLRTVEIEYIWNVPSALYFENNIFPEIYDSVNGKNKIEFEIETTVSGK